MSQSRFNFSLPPNPFGLASALGAMTLAAGLVIGSSEFSPASAFTFGSTSEGYGTVGITSADINQSFDVNYSLASPDLSGKATFAVTGLTSSLLNLDVTLSNLTSTTFQSAIVSLGLGVDPNATSVSITNNSTGVTWDASLNPHPQDKYLGFQNIDICVFGANGCTGGDIKDGLASGGVDSFSLAIGGNFSSGVTLGAFPVKFQTEIDSYTVPGQPVPEPASMLGIMAFGALGGGRLLRKKKQQAA